MPVSEEAQKTPISFLLPSYSALGHQEIPETHLGVFPELQREAERL